MLKWEKQQLKWDQQQQQAQDREARWEKWREEAELLGNATPGLAPLVPYPQGSHVSEHKPLVPTAWMACANIKLYDACAERHLLRGGDKMAMARRLVAANIAAPPVVHDPTIIVVEKR